MRIWCRLALWTVGIRVLRKGTLPPPGSLVVLNHVSYLDILIVGAVAPGYFIAKSEISRWPLVGWVARIGRTLFVDRESPRRSRLLIDEMARRMEKGGRILLFPEGGILTGGEGVAAFRPMLFEASVRTGRPVAPAAFRYTSPSDPSVWAWSDSSSLFQHLLHRVFPADAIEVELSFGPLLTPEPGLDRKRLAELTRLAVLRLCDEPEREEGGGA
jgi:1-acyl-sn-glycerol-3-phosphate acyltransferase